ncbi:MAG TPA: cysteine desulfurase [Stellaceae bacterium]|nr:cysteine desulfurase [Stellaceae bacterium]HMD65677.1 cysteine desulfurase [Stellaceae bacterium]
MRAASLRSVYPAAPTLPSPASGGAPGRPPARAGVPGVGRGFDPHLLKREFPIFASNPDLVFLDSGASAQKPRSVIDRVSNYYGTDYANVHRGVYRLSARSTELFEEAREKMRGFLNATDSREIVFVRGATEGINLVAQSWGPAFLKAGDEILISELEHHSNIVPWQMLRDRLGIRLIVAPIDATGGLDLSSFAACLSPRTRLVAITHLANATGALVPIETLVRLAHQEGARVLIDGCQAAPRLPVDVQALGCDFYTFSGHKTYGPTGIGVLYGRWELLSAMPPWQGGGEMILNVTFEKTEFQEPPHRFEAGTPDISGAIGLGTAIDFIEALGRDNILEHEEALTGYGVDRLSRIPGLTLLGAGQRRLGILSFDLEGVHPHDLAQVLDQHHVAVRAGHHCAQPLLEKLGHPATTRASLGVYNDERDIDRLVEAIEAAREMFGR